MSSQLYWKLYAILCGAASDAIDLLSAPNGHLQAKTILEKALQTTEDLYVAAELKENDPSEMMETEGSKAPLCKEGGQISPKG